MCDRLICDRVFLESYTFVLLLLVIIADCDKPSGQRQAQPSWVVLPLFGLVGEQPTVQLWWLVMQGLYQICNGFQQLVLIISSLTEDWLVGN